MNKGLREQIQSDAHDYFIRFELDIEECVTLLRKSLESEFANPGVRK